MDEKTKKTLSAIPLLKTKAGPRDKELWPQRLKEEYQSLIKVIFLFFSFFVHFLVQNYCFFTSGFSMLNKTKQTTTTGFESNQTKPAQDGSASAGTFMNCLSTSLTLSLTFQSLIQQLLQKLLFLNSTAKLQKCFEVEKFVFLITLNPCGLEMPLSLGSRMPSL